MNNQQQNTQALNSAQQATQQTGIQFNTFIGRAQAASVASVAPPIALPQRQIPPTLLRGRTEVLHLVEKHLTPPVPETTVQSTPVAILHGIGGIGKTTLALELAHRKAAQGVQVWWLNGSSPALLTAALHALAFAAGATDTEFDRAHPADVLWNNLNTYDGSWLVVFDNVDDPNILAADSGFLSQGTGWLRPPSSRGAILVTSRDGRKDLWPSWAAMIPVKSLTPDDGAQVLLDLAPGCGPREDARALAVALGGVPLALELAGKYLASAATDPFPPPNAVTSFADYRSSFEQRLTSLPLDEDPAHSGHNRRVLSTTWEISLDLLTDQGHTAARPLLRLLACSAAAPLPYRPLLNLEILRQSPFFTGLSHAKLSGALRALAGLGLISLDVADNAANEWGYAVTLHPLVRTVTRANLKRAGIFEEFLDLFLSLLEAVSADLDPENTHHWPCWELITEHTLEALSSAAHSTEPKRERVARALRPAVQAAWYQYMAGRYTRSVNDLSTIYAAARTVLSPEDPMTLHVRNRRARAMRENGQSAQAEEEFREIRETARRVLGENHPETLNISINLARTIRERGDIAQAQAEFADLCQRARKVLGDNHPDTLAATYNLARTLRDQRRFSEAGTLYREALAARRTIFPETDLTTLDLRYELAETLREQGEFSAAQQEYRNVLAVTSRVYGDQHPNTLIIRHGLARVLLAAGQETEARNELTEVWQGRQEVLGADHPLTQETERELQPLR